MGIFSRLSDIVNANINSMLERAEDPGKIIRLMIQEMEDTLVEVRQTAARIIAERKGLRRRAGDLAAAQSEWGRKAELALSKDREDLAKGALVEKAKLAEMAAALGDELTRLDEALGRHEQDIVKLESKLREARAKRQAIIARHDSVSATLKARRSLHGARIDDALTRFAQMEARVDRAEGEAEALDLGAKKSLSEEIAELESADVVEAELEALKAALAKTDKPQSDKPQSGKPQSGTSKSGKPKGGK